MPLDAFVALSAGDFRLRTRSLVCCGWCCRVTSSALDKADSDPEFLVGTGLASRRGRKVQDVSQILRTGLQQSGMESSGTHLRSFSIEAA